MSLALLFHHLLLNVFRMLIHPSSGACDLMWIYFMCKSQAPEDGCTNIRNMLSSKWWNNKASDIKLVYLYSTIKLMHGLIKLIIRCVSTHLQHLQGVFSYRAKVTKCIFSALISVIWSEMTEPSLDSKRFSFVAGCLPDSSLCVHFPIVPLT